LGGQAQAVVSAPGRLSARGRRTFREVPTSQLFIVFFASFCIPLLRSVELGVFGWREFVGLFARGCRTVRPGLPDCPRGSDCPRGGHGPSVFQGALLEVLLCFTDCPLEGRGPSTWTSAELLSPLLLEFRFRFGIV
jgi:hypothetical protein